MPRILVTADGPDGHEAAVLLQQRVFPSDLETDRLCARLVERVGWALVDADEIEHRTASPAVARTRKARPTGRGGAKRTPSTRTAERSRR